MICQKLILTALLLALLSLNLACADNNAGGDLSVDGAVIETGLQLDEEMQITNPQYEFFAGQDFYFYFDNNGSIGSERLTIQLVNGKDNRVLAEHTYQVEPADKSISDGIFFGSPGRYLITARIDGIVRATREVTIK